MFNFTRDKRTNLEKRIDKAIDALSNFDPNSKDYEQIAKNINVLYEAKSHEKCRGISPDVVASIVGNLLGIGLILGYERVNVITTKAFSFIKGRI
jgi:hypothetical protein